MGLISIPKKNNNNPLNNFNIDFLENIYYSIINDQANKIIPLLNEELNKRKDKIYKVFSIFDKKDYIEIKLPIKIYKENLNEMRSKGFIPLVIEEISLQDINDETKPLPHPTICIYDKDTKLYIYKFKWTIDSVAYNYRKNIFS
jgi:hypothetical protein